MVCCQVEMQPRPLRSRLPCFLAEPAVVLEQGPTSVSFSVRTLKWICILIAHSLQCLRSRPQDTFPLVHPFPHSLTSLSLCLFSIVCHLCCLSFSLSCVCMCILSLLAPLFSPEKVFLSP